VVDDQPQILVLLQDFLKDCGFRVLAAQNGSQAEQVSANHQDTLHLLITDIEMPDGDGLALAQKLKAQRPDIAVIYMSGSLKTLPESSEEFIAGSICLEKPVIFSDLQAAISTLLR
jgi:DNA-binding response OmpR family regulator